MPDNDVELDCHRRSRDHENHENHGNHDNHDNHDHDSDRDSDSDHDHVPKARLRRLPTLRRYMALASHHARSHHEVVYLLLVPTLYFRCAPLLLTHNSMPLSAYLAVVLVYVPAKVVLAAWAAYSPSSHAAANRRKRRTSSSLLLLLSSSNGSGASSSAPASTVGSVLWLCAAVFSLWVYTWGISSPFPTAASIVAASPTLRAHQARNASYFIAASFFNNEPILDAWTAQTLELVDALGPANVYISLTENDSEDNTASKLLHFGRELTRRNVTHSVNITMDLRGYPPENPWRSVKHRMGYMTNLRNGALEPLGRLNRRFENVVVLNDVVYHHTDVLKLIAAVGGDDVVVDGGGGDPHDSYDARDPHDAVSGGRPRAGKRRMACGVDMDGASLYDAWVLRDRCGRPVSGFWPFFTAEKDKRAVREGRVLDVGTCWNGIVVLDGDMLLDPRLRSKDADWGADPLRFGQPPECIISECALLPLAITNVTGGAPVVMDPTVVVAYTVHWWRYYAVWLRMPVVRLWMQAFEERYWGLWWSMGMGKLLRWKGLDNGKDKGECVVSGWPTCGSSEHVVRGAMRLRNQTGSS